MEVTGKRFVGIDLGKRTWEMVIVKQNGKLEKDETVEKKVFHNGKTTAEGRATLYKKLESGDTVALEAGNLAFIIAKEIEKAVGCKVIVLNPYQLAVIYASYKKTR
jgi:transposase